MNSGVNVLGQGNRANSTIGRALQLVVRNVGGGRPGEVDRATHGNPGKLVVLLRRGRRGVAVGTLAGSRGVPEGVDAVTVFAGEGPRCVVDQLSRTPESLASASPPTCGRSTIPSWCSGSTRSSSSAPSTPACSPTPAGIATGSSPSCTRGCSSPAARSCAAPAASPKGSPSRCVELDAAEVPPDGLLLAYAGGGAGLFSAIIGGWANGTVGSTPVTREVRY